ncbi:MAG: tyrosine--tRNA ligase [bacterium]
MKKIVIGKIIALNPINNNLQQASINLGDETITLVTGAPNVRLLQLVAVALPGAEIFDIKSQKMVTVITKKFEDVISAGVLASGKELGINNDHSGILTFDSSYQPGDVIDTNILSHNPRWNKYLKLNQLKEPQMDVIIDPILIEQVLTRGVKEIFPGKAALKQLMLSGKRLKLYTGIDPTANFIHMGHFIWMKKLAEFQKLGHQVIFLIGGFTAMVGDPDKQYTREPLTKDQVWANFQSYQKTAANILDFDWEANPITILNNFDWLSKITLEDWLQIMSSVTMQHILSHDMFKKRLVEEQPIRLHELSYPLMQGFDCVAMNVDLEVGGSDQTFNMLTGRILARELINKEKFVLTLKLLTDTSGKKMGKTTGNAISSNDSPENMYGKVMAWADNMIFQGFELLTDENLKEFSEKNIAADPMQFKKILAKTIVSKLKTKAAAEQAAEFFTKTVQQKEAPTDIRIIKREELLNLNNKQITSLVKNLLSITALTNSNAEAKRLIIGGAVWINNEKFLDPNQTVELNKIEMIKAGKRNWLKIID